jgi:hypothetical protein
VSRGGARSLRPLDVTRLGQAATRPGSDPRSWLFVGTVTEVAYDEGLVVVVHANEGALAGEEVPCEVLGFVATAGGTVATAIAVGDLALALCPSGDPNNMGLVVGFQHEPATPPPATVNGVPINAALLADTHVLADVERAAEVELKTLRLVVDQLRLGPTPSPTQAFVRGTAFAKALKTFLDGCTTLATTTQTASTAASSACVGPLAPLKAFFDAFTPALVKWKTDIAALKAHLVEGDALSKHITGE